MSQQSVLTLHEVRERFRFRSDRQLRDFVRRHGIRVFDTGRQISFDQQALEALETALRRNRPPNPNV